MTLSEKQAEKLVKLGYAKIDDGTFGYTDFGNQMIKDIRVDFLIDKEVQLDASCCKDNSVPSEVSLRKCQY